MQARCCLWLRCRASFGPDDSARLTVLCDVTDSPAGSMVRAQVCRRYAPSGPALPSLGAKRVVPPQRKTRDKGLCFCQAIAPSAVPRKIAIFVEPSPFSHVSGMKIRFSNLIRGLREIGDEVTVVTPCVDPPKTFCGAKVCVCPYGLQLIC